jgi:hypothetical protein
MGRFASFEIRPDGLGVKTFKTKEICDFAFYAQNEAYKLGYATKVVARLSDTELLMEVADTSISDELEDGRYYDDVFVRMADALWPIISKNPFKKKKQKMHQLDFARHNLGIYKNRIVLIDFT